MSGERPLRALRELASKWTKLAELDVNHQAASLGLAWRIGKAANSPVGRQVAPIVYSLLRNLQAGGGIAVIVLPWIRKRAARRAIKSAALMGIRTLVSPGVGIVAPQAILIGAIGATGEQLAFLLWQLSREQSMRHTTVEYPDGEPLHIQIKSANDGLCLSISSSDGRLHFGHCGSELALWKGKLHKGEIRARDGTKLYLRFNRNIARACFDRTCTSCVVRRSDDVAGPALCAIASEPLSVLPTTKLSKSTLISEEPAMPSQMVFAEPPTTDAMAMTGEMAIVKTGGEMASLEPAVMNSSSFVGFVKDVTRSSLGAEHVQPWWLAALSLLGFLALLGLLRGRRRRRARLAASLELALSEKAQRCSENDKSGSPQQVRSVETLVIQTPLAAASDSSDEFSSSSDSECDEGRYSEYLSSPDFAHAVVWPYGSPEPYHRITKEPKRQTGHLIDTSATKPSGSHKEVQAKELRTPGKARDIPLKRDARTSLYGHGGELAGSFAYLGATRFDLGSNDMNYTPSVAEKASETSSPPLHTGAVAYEEGEADETLSEANEMHLQEVATDSKEKEGKAERAHEVQEDKMMSDIEAGLKWSNREEIKETMTAPFDGRDLVEMSSIQHEGIRHSLLEEERAQMSVEDMKVLANADFKIEESNVDQAQEPSRVDSFNHQSCMDSVPEESILLGSEDHPSSLCAEDESSVEARRSSPVTDSSMDGEESSSTNAVTDSSMDGEESLMETEDEQNTAKKMFNSELEKVMRLHAERRQSSMDDSYLSSLEKDVESDTKAGNTGGEASSITDLAAGPLIEDDSETEQPNGPMIRVGRVALLSSRWEKVIEAQRSPSQPAAVTPKDWSLSV